MFKTYSEIENAKCFNCGETLNPQTVEKSGYAPGNGDHVARCNRCGMATWFNYSPLVRHNSGQANSFRICVH